MATTLKASSTKAVPAGASNPTAAQGGWTHCASGIVFKGADDASDGSALTCLTGTNASGNSNYRMGAWIYGPLAAQSISGTVCVTIRGKCGTFVCDEHPTTAIYLMKPCGVKRTTLKARTAAAAFFGTALSDVTFQVTMCTQTVVAGDYLVVEAGYTTCFLCIATVTIQSGSTGPHTRWVFNGVTIQLQSGVPNSLMMLGVGT